MRRWWVLLVLIVLIVGGGMALRGGRKSPAAPKPEATLTAVPVEAVRVTQGTVVRTVEVSGTVIAPRSAEVVPKISGRVTRVLVQDGARVSAGQVLVELDSTDQQTDVRQAEAAVAAARARLALLESGLRPQEKQIANNALSQAQNQVIAAESQVAVAQSTVKVAEDNLRRQEQLLRDGAIAQAQVDQARLQHDQARAQLQATQAQLELARSGVDTARQQVEIAQAGARSEEVQVGRAVLAQARAVAALARQRLAYMSIRAPIAGRVSGVTTSPGDYLVSGDFPGRAAPVALVYDDRALEVEVKVGERDIGLVRVGQPARLRLESAPATAVEASVAVISPAADPMSRASSARLRLKSSGLGTVLGTFARGEIVVEERAGALLVPAAAIAGGDAPVIRVVVDRGVQVRPVTLGLVQGDRIEVKTGVSVGELVVVLGPENLPAGTIVQVVNR